MRARTYSNALTAIAPVTMETIRRFAPIVKFNRNETCFPCSIEHILRVTRLLQVDKPATSISNPSQALLSQFQNAEAYRLEFTTDHDTGWKLAYRGFQPSPWSPSNGGDWANSRLRAQMYVAVQKGKENGTDCIDVSYAFLFAYQDGITIRGDRSGTPFNCIAHNIGEHHGDLEHIVVRLTGDASSVTKVGYAAHGETPTWHTPGNYDKEGDHPLVYSEQNSHASRNITEFQGSGTHVTDSGIMTMDIEGGDGLVKFIGVGDTGGPQWRPHEDYDSFRIINTETAPFDTRDAAALKLDFRKLMEPVGAELWAAFAGRIGQHQDGKMKSATTLWGTSLSTWDWDYIKVLGDVMTAGNSLASRITGDDKMAEDGPHGIADKPWSSLVPK